METLTLHRQPSTPEGTFGQIFRDGKQLCVTCEPVVPFPPGKYLCITHNGPHFQNVWEITGIPGHEAVLIHNGNTIEDTELCVLVGSTYGPVHGLRGVINSRLTLDLLRTQLPETFYLRVQ